MPDGAGPELVPVVEALREWSVLAGPSEAMTPGVLDLDLEEGTVVVSLAGRATSLLLAGTGEAQIVHESRLDWTVQEGRYEDRRLVVTENDEIFGGVYRLWLYDPLDQQPLLIAASDGGGEAPFFLPTTSLEGSRLAYTVENPDGTVCIVVRDLETSSEERTACGPTPDHDIIFPSLGDGTIGYLLIDAAAEPRCDQFVVHRDAPTPEVLEVTPCAAFTGAADELLAVWTESGPDAAVAPIFGRGIDGVTHALGEASANFVTVCDGRAYWRTQQSAVQELRTWTTGENVEIILRRPTFIGFPACDGDTVAVYVGGIDGSRAGEILVSSVSGAVPAPVTLEFNP